MQTKRYYSKPKIKCSKNNNIKRSNSIQRKKINYNLDNYPKNNNNSKKLIYINIIK